MHFVHTGKGIHPEAAHTVGGHAHADQQDAEQHHPDPSQAISLLFAQILSILLSVTAHAPVSLLKAPRVPAAGSKPAAPGPQARGQRKPQSAKTAGGQKHWHPGHRKSSLFALPALPPGSNAIPGGRTSSDRIRVMHFSSAAPRPHTSSPQHRTPCPTARRSAGSIRSTHRRRAGSSPPPAPPSAPSCGSRPGAS